MIKLSTIKPNPENPRYIDEKKFADLKRSIEEFPEMMRLRPMIIDDESIVLGGNMRLKALLELGYKEVKNDWILKASELTPEQKREFIIKDNVGFGEWDWDILANEWDELQLIDWGLDIPDVPEEPSDEGEAKIFKTLKRLEKLWVAHGDDLTLVGNSLYNGKEEVEHFPGINLNVDKK